MILLFFFACPGLLLQKKMKKMLVGTRKTKKNADEEMKELEEKKSLWTELERTVSMRRTKQTELLQSDLRYLLEDWRAERALETHKKAESTLDLNCALWKHSVVSVNSKESFSFFFRIASIIIKKGSLSRGGSR